MNQIGSYLPSVRPVLFLSQVVVESELVIVVYHQINLYIGIERAYLFKRYLGRDGRGLEPLAMQMDRLSILH